MSKIIITDIDDEVKSNSENYILIHKDDARIFAAFVEENQKLFNEFHKKKSKKILKQFEKYDIE
jgi:hypothetical protein